MTLDQMAQLAQAHYQAGRLREAEALYRQILALQPDHPEVLNILAVVTAQAGRNAEAEQFIRRAIAINPSEARYYINLGLIHRGTCDAAQAIDAYHKAIALAPRYAQAYSGLGVALGMLARHEEACKAYREAISLGPEGATADTYARLGTALAELNRVDEAGDAFRRALELDPQYPEASSGFADVQWRRGRAEETVEILRPLLRRRPHAKMHSILLFSMQFSPRETAQSIYEEHRRFNDLYARPLQQIATIRPHTNNRDPDRRLRIGCMSSDFRNHVLALYTIPLFKAHDRRQIELFCYSNVPAPDHVTEMIRPLADVWRETWRLSDEQAAEVIRGDAIDILVDHNMHMTDARPLVMARKPAPLQVAWLAYPGTTGLDAVDYRFTDPHLDPPGTEAGKYSEQSIRLPHTFWCFDPMRNEPVVDPPAMRNGCITFGCMNNFAKVNDGVLSLWSRVLRDMPGSRLLMLAPQGNSRAGVIDRLGALGIESSRIEFAAFAPRREYLRTYHRIDIALDTTPYNGHTTSMDAMWMGVPVVTLIGQTIVGRAGWSQLNNLQLTELAAHDEDGFVHIATELASDVPRLRDLRLSLRERMRASPLVDAPRFARDMEAAFRTMWQRWCATSR